jgi:hypothetical protein
MRDMASVLPQVHGILLGGTHVNEPVALNQDAPVNLVSALFQPWVFEPKASSPTS